MNEWFEMNKKNQKAEAEGQDFSLLDWLKEDPGCATLADAPELARQTLTFTMTC